MLKTRLISSGSGGRSARGYTTGGGGSPTPPAPTSGIKKIIIDGAGNYYAIGMLTKSKNVYKSTDMVNWSIVYTAPNDLTDLCGWSNTYFGICGKGGFVARSANGTVWTDLSDPALTDDYIAISIGQEAGARQIYVSSTNKIYAYDSNILWPGWILIDTEPANISLRFAGVAPATGFYPIFFGYDGTAHNIAIRSIHPALTNPPTVDPAAIAIDAHVNGWNTTYIGNYFAADEGIVEATTPKLYPTRYPQYAIATNFSVGLFTNISCGAQGSIYGINGNGIPLSLQFSGYVYDFETCIYFGAGNSLFIVAGKGLITKVNLNNTLLWYESLIVLP